MKKLIIVSALLCSLLFVPVLASAQATDNSALIAQLQAEIKSLMQQIAAILAQHQTLIAGCTSTMGYSTTTGVPCNGTITPSQQPSTTNNPAPITASHIQCNGISYNPCAIGKNSYCPPTGIMICYNPGDIFCNNQYWTPCPSGYVAYCSLTGEICQTPTLTPTPVKSTQDFINQNPQCTNYMGTPTSASALAGQAGILWQECASLYNIYLGGTYQPPITQPSQNQYLNYYCNGNVCCQDGQRNCYIKLGN